MPKFKIEVRGRSLFAWSLHSLQQFLSEDDRLIFVARAEDDAKQFIAAECACLGIQDFRVVELDSTTDGQATSALLAAAAIADEDRPLAIYNIDTFVEPQSLKTGPLVGAGWIPCFQAPGDHWSFVALDGDGRVTEVREKKRISPYATIGLYWFSSFGLYRDAYQRFYVEQEKSERGERYVAPLYNQLIDDGLPVHMHEVPYSAVHALGTPEEVHAFAAQVH
jgi:hypothetical protein